MTEPTIPPGSSIGGDVFTGGKRDIRTDGGDYYEGVAPVGVAALHQLPAPPGDFTGRAAELAELRKAVKEQGAAISGLRGLGGVGKTALALTLAYELKADYPDAQIFLNLQGAAHPLTPAAVMAHVIRAYKPVETLPDDLAQLAAAYRSVLDGQRALILLDNSANAEQIKPLIPPPGCLLIVTSRQKFTLPGLKAVNLDSLSSADAQALLLKLAPRIVGLAGDIARQCGCLPLALTLAGSALAEREDLEPAVYLRRLEQTGLKVLDEVEASISLSYDLLSAEFQRLWSALSVFPGDFDVLAAEAVWQLEAEMASECLSGLLKYSLLEFNLASKRYRLHDLARKFCQVRIGDAERAIIQRRHAAHYKVMLVAANDLYLAGGANTLQGLALFDLERENIVAGQARAAVLAIQDEGAAGLTSDYPDAGMYVLDLRQHPREKIAWLDAAVSAARQINNREAEGAHLGNLGLAYAALGEMHRAIEFYDRQLIITREIGDRRGQGNALGNLGLAYVALGEPRRAIEFCEQALVIDREVSHRRGQGADLGNLGLAYAAEGEPRRAIEFYEQALPIAREVGDRQGEGNALGSLGNAYSALGESRRAIEFHEQALVIDREIGDRRGEGAVLGNLGLAYAVLGEPQRAIEYYEQQLVITREIGDQRGESIASWNLGWVYEKQGELGKAIALMQFRVDYLRELRHPDADKHAARVDEIRTRLAGDRK